MISQVDPKNFVGEKLKQFTANQSRPTDYLDLRTQTKALAKLRLRLSEG